MKNPVKANALLLLAWLLAGCQQQPPSPPAAEAPVQPQPQTPAVAEAPKAQTPAAMVVTGIFAGRSGKPMVKARLVLGEIVSDDQYRYSKVRLVPHVPTAVTNAEGRFEFKGFKPGEYTIVYQPAGTGGLLPNELLIRTLTATTASITPLLRGFELGTDKVFPERPWGTLYTLLPGHTLHSEGPTMRIWNATVRHKQSGAHLEMRRGAPWTQRFEPGGQIRFEAWSF
jgi:hypothetical protein